MYDTTAAMLVQAIQLCRNPRFSALKAAFVSFAHCTGNDTLVTVMEQLVEQASQIPEVSRSLVTRVARVRGKKRLIRSEKSFLPTFLGRLGAKEEPGKVRVFAMVD